MVNYNTDVEYLKTMKEKQENLYEIRWIFRTSQFHKHLPENASNCTVYCKNVNVEMTVRAGLIPS